MTAARVREATCAGAALPPRPRSDQRHELPPPHPSSGGKSALNAALPGDHGAALWAGILHRIDRGDAQSCRGRANRVRRWSPSMVRKGLEVLHNCSEVELVACTGDAPQTHPLEAVMGLQVRKTRSRLDRSKASDPRVIERSHALAHSRRAVSSVLDCSASTSISE
jgi:hypothetical protein